MFAFLNDPVGSGIVASLSHPGGNITGFAGLEYGFSAKWLQLLKQIAPNVTRVAVVRDLTGPGRGQKTCLRYKSARLAHDGSLCGQI